LGETQKQEKKRQLREKSLRWRDGHSFVIFRAIDIEAGQRAQARLVAPSWFDAARMDPRVKPADDDAISAIRSDRIAFL